MEEASSGAVADSGAAAVDPETLNISQLLAVLRQPGRYIERRTDELRDLSASAVEWSVRLQVRLPPMPASDAQAFRLISLGIFPKKRLPDLRAFDAADAELPLLRRVDRTRAITSLLLQDVLVAIQAEPSDEKVLTELAFGFVSKQPAAAQIKFDEYSSLLRALSTEGVEEHLTFAQHFVHSTHVLASVPINPTGYQLISFRYSERNGLPVRPHVKWNWRSIRLLLRYWGMTLGLLSVPFDLKLSGANHAHSYYLLVSPPAGTEIEALYWRFLDQRPTGQVVQPPTSEDYIHESKHAVLACYHRDHDVRGGQARVDVRLNGAALRPLWLLNVILMVAGIYFARNTNTNLSSSVSLFAAIPAALVAFATQSKHELTAELGKWVRRSQVLLSVIAGVVGLSAVGNLVSGTGKLAELLNDQGVAAILAGYAAASSVILGYICFRGSGPASGPTGTASQAYVNVSEYRKQRRQRSLLVVFASLGLTAVAVAAALW